MRTRSCLLTGLAAACALAVACGDDEPSAFADAGAPDAIPLPEAAGPDRCVGVDTMMPKGNAGDPNIGGDAGANYGNVPFPKENPYSYEKAILGKILFWDEQVSSDDTVACGTCHRPAAGGSDSRGATHPGPDKTPGTADDVHGGRGIARCVTDPAGKAYRISDPTFGMNVQVTKRKPPSYLDAMFAQALFWDGRAGTKFVDPERPNVVVIEAGGALESQAVGPPMGDSEMACEARTWAALTSKLAVAQPLALASNIPAPMMAAICKHRTYPQLFNAAFGTPEITGARFAMAIATHERTLISNQAPHDRDVAGDTGAMTDAQKRGRQAFGDVGCGRCHRGPNFGFNETGGLQFANLGFQTTLELAFDRGRAQFTGDDGDIGKFRSVGLRNVGLREKFGLLHDGKGDGASLESVVQAYSAAPKRNGNTHPFLETSLNLPPPLVADLVAFMREALTDPRAKDELPPFDRPRLKNE
jgi:cytochrome c peroxidase